MTITLRQLRYVIALAESGHFGEAATACHVTQPALSQQIRALEALIGAPLFDRLSKTVRPTPLGREVVDRARDIVARTDDLMAFAATRGGAPTRPIRFGLIPTVAPYLLPEIFPSLMAELPQIRFAVSESRTDALLAGLGDGALDIALIATDPPRDGPPLEVEPLFTDQFVLATSASETTSNPVDLHKVDPGRMLLLDEGHCFRDQAISACGLDGSAHARTFAATSLSTIVEFVANGQGVTLLPEIALRKETDARIAVHPLAAPVAGRLLRLVWRQGAPYGDLHARIAETIRRSRHVMPAAEPPDAATNPRRTPPAKPR